MSQHIAVEVALRWHERIQPQLTEWINEPMMQWTSHGVNEPANKLTSESMCQLTNGQRIKKPQRTNEPTNQRINQPVNEWFHVPGNQSVHHGANDSMRIKRIMKPTAQWITGSTLQSAWYATSWTWTMKLARVVFPHLPGENRWGSFGFDKSATPLLRSSASSFALFHLSRF